MQNELGAMKQQITINTRTFNDKLKVLNAENKKLNDKLSSTLREKK